MGLKRNDRAHSRQAAPSRGQTAGLPSRRAAASVLRKVVDGQVPLDMLLDDKQGHRAFKALDRRDRSLVRAILVAALRHRGEIQEAIEQRLERPLGPEPGTLSAVLHVAIAQILYLDIPDHAAVSLGVAAVDADRRIRPARPLANSLLRRIARERNEILSRPDRGRRNSPVWLFDRWVDAYGPEVAEDIGQAHLRQPLLDITPRGDPLPVAKALGGTLLPTGSVRLSGNEWVPSLPGYDEGLWWVQDAAAAMPARLLGDVSGLRVADLCAAPGGKTSQLAAAGGNVTAVDISASRLRRLNENLRRLSLNAEVMAADILNAEPGEQFDCVLLDAPCSATGTIRRHPDVAWVKSEKDVATLAGLQKRLLSTMSPWLRSGGSLVYCVCSLEPDEGELQAEAFLADNPQFSPDPIQADEVAGLTHLLTGAGYLRTLPCFGMGEGETFQGMDGFFAARFKKY